MKHIYYWLFALTLGGVLFSGYLSVVKFFSNTCALNESCPYFFGYPACYFGFVMFLIMFINTFYILWRKNNYESALKIDAIISFLGIMFAGYFAAIEFLSGTITGVLGFSTCVYGLIFYILIFGISIRALQRAY